MGWGAASSCASYPGKIIALIVVLILSGVICIWIAVDSGWPWLLTLIGFSLGILGLGLLTLCSKIAWFAE